MNILVLREKDLEQERMVQDHHATAQDVIDYIQGLGGTGRKKIALLIERPDGPDNARGV